MQAPQGPPATFPVLTNFFEIRRLPTRPFYHYDGTSRRRVREALN